ncbi:protein of unknown function [Burkholderia multivorans]
MTDGVVSVSRPSPGVARSVAPSRPTRASERGGRRASWRRAGAVSNHDRKPAYVASTAVAVRGNRMRAMPRRPGLLPRRQSEARQQRLAVGCQPELRIRGGRRHNFDEPFLLERGRVGVSERHLSGGTEEHEEHGNLVVT